jgi:hypothetical protein
MDANIIRVSISLKATPSQYAEFAVELKRLLGNANVDVLTTAAKRLTADDTLTMAESNGIGEAAVRREMRES